jgi:3-deoxy-manno-octulosonate cytidylyltransferase (CMP-KDO synthetase)
MLWHVYQGVRSARRIDDVFIVSDSEEVLKEARSWGANALMTPEDCPSGTDRIALVADAMNTDIVVNVQGDEPLISGEILDQLVTSLESSTADVATPVYPITTLDELTNPNVVKVVKANDGTALYFSRSPVPYVRDADLPEWLDRSKFWGHAGVYAYRKSVLKEFPNLREGTLEKVEKLEQLRLLEAGKRFLTVEIDYRPHAVDVPADLEAVKQIMASEGRRP